MFPDYILGYPTMLFLIIFFTLPLFFIRPRSTNNVGHEGPIVTVLIILITRIGLRFWGPYHIQKLKKIGVRMGTGEFFFISGVVFGHAH